MGGRAMLGHLFPRGASTFLTARPWSCTSVRAIRSGLDVEGFVSTLSCHHCGEPGHRASVCPTNPKRKIAHKGLTNALEVDRRKGSAWKKERTARAAERSLIECHKCGEKGHVARNCKGSAPAASRNEQQPGTASSAKPMVVCYKCGGSGHIARVCPKVGSPNPTQTSPMVNRHQKQ